MTSTAKRRTARRAWRRRLVGARRCRSSRTRTGAWRSTGAREGATGTYDGRNAGWAGASAPPTREANVDNSAVSSRGIDSTHVPPEAHKLPAVLLAQHSGPGFPHTSHMSPEIRTARLPTWSDALSGG